MTAYGGGENRLRTLCLISSGKTKIEKISFKSDHTKLKPAREDLVLIALKWPGLKSVLPYMLSRIKKPCTIIMPQNGITCRVPPVCTLGVNITPTVALLSARLIKQWTAHLVSFTSFLLPEEYLWLAKAYPALRFSCIPEIDFMIEQKVKLAIATTSARMAIEDLSIGSALEDEEICQDLANIFSESALAIGNEKAREAYDKCEEAFATGNLGPEIVSLKDGLTSLHQDLNRKVSETEIKYINGYVVRLGQLRNKKTPLNNFLIREIEIMCKSGITPSIANEDHHFRQRIKSFFNEYRLQSIAEGKV